MLLQQVVENEPAIIVSQSFKSMGKNNSPCLEIVVEFEHLTDETGVKCTQVALLWLTQKALENSCKTLRHLGWKGTDLKELSPLVEGFHSLQGTKCFITTTKEEYQGKVSFKVRWINGTAGSRVMREGDLSTAADAARKFLEADGNEVFMESGEGQCLV